MVLNKWRVYLALQKVPTLPGRPASLPLFEVYPSELEINDTTDSLGSALYLDLYLNYIAHERLLLKLNDKRGCFNFSIINIPLLCINIPPYSAYGVLV